MTRAAVPGRPRSSEASAFTRILVPTDLTTRTKRSFEMACRLVAPGGTVTLLHVIEQVPGLSVSELAGFYRKLERRANAVMMRMAHGAASGVSVVSHITIGSRPEEIVRVAAARRADLIVLGSHRVRPSRALHDWGTISYKVGLLARCPVLLIK